MADTERLHISWWKVDQHRTDIRFDQDPGGGWGRVGPPSAENIQFIRQIADRYDAEIVDPEDILGRVERGEPLAASKQDGSDDV